MRTFSEFKQHIELHRERVVKLGLTLAKIKFPQLDSALLEKFLGLHDHSKTLTSLNQISLGIYPHRDLPAERLFAFFGKTSKTSLDQKNLSEVINDVNRIDKKVSDDFFISYPDLSAKIREDFFTIERVADLVDRSLDPMAVEEFGQSMRLASEFIQDPHLAKLSLWLETHYFKITKNLTF